MWGGRGRRGKELDLGLRCLVGDHQTYGLRGRSIARNLHAMRIVREASGEGHQPLAALQLKMSQAFDRVSHEFLRTVLKKCEVGDEMLDWVGLCYQDISTRLLVNDDKGRFMSIGRSVRQGCSLSPILFALQLEPLCRDIIRDTTIQGLQMGSQHVALICSSEAQVETALQHVAVFPQASGAEVNQWKSTGAWLWDGATAPKIFADIEWRTTVDSYLGVPIGERGPTVEKWRQKTNAIQAKLSRGSTGGYRSLIELNCQSDSPRLGELHLEVDDGEDAAQQPLPQFGGRRSGPCERVLKLHVQRFLLFRDRSDHLFLTALHHLGYPYLGRWMVSTTGRTTRGVGLRFYAEIATSVESFLVHFSWEYLLAASRKTLYWDTLAIVLPVAVPLYKMEPVLLCAAGLFKRVRRFPVPASTKDFFVRLHFEVLPVKEHQISVLHFQTSPGAVRRSCCK
ncbi:hypothetical protein ISCGN_001125 [Ixodes scapularis]